MSKITEKAVLVSLRISQFTGSKKDQKITKEVANNHNAQEDAGSYNKRLISKEAVGAIQTIAGKARVFHYENTLPWSDEGSRLLPTRRYMTYVSEIKQLEFEFNSKVDEVVEKYDEIIEEAKQRRGDMFDINEYPSKEELRKKYGFKFNIYPVPDSNDFRISLSQHEIDKMKEEMEDNMRQIQTNATKDIWKRLYDVVDHMAKTMKNEDKQFQKSTVDNIKELCEILPDLNITEDIMLEEMRKEIVESLTKVEPDVLRTDKVLRKDIGEQASEICRKMEAYL